MIDETLGLDHKKIPPQPSIRSERFTLDREALAVVTGIKYRVLKLHLMRGTRDRALVTDRLATALGCHSAQ